MYIKHKISWGFGVVLTVISDFYRLNVKYPLRSSNVLMKSNCSKWRIKEQRSILIIVLVEMLIDNIVRIQNNNVELMKNFAAIEYLRIVPSIKEEI